jgi:16S rRNA (guanine(966)-N(2))-methyltransferase RsmD
MRIIAGSLKGRRLAAPPGLGTRPLPDRIKQALFDWLGQRFDGKTVADVCAGSGAFGLEAFSRGAAQVWLVEPDAAALKALRANRAACGDPAPVEVVAAPFQAALPRLTGLDLVFCDPPFPWFRDEPETLAELLRLAAAALAPGGEVVVRGERGENLPPVVGLVEADRRAYGRSWVARLRGKTGP